MKKTLLVLAAVAALTSPLLAQQLQGSEEGRQNGPAATTGQAPATATQRKTPPAVRGPNDVYCAGEYLGSDPSASVREQMKRDYKHECE